MERDVEERQELDLRQTVNGSVKFVFKWKCFEIFLYLLAGAVGKNP